MPCMKTPPAEVKRLMNKETNARLAKVRAEVNRLQIMHSVKNFVVMMHKKMKGGHLNHKKNYPWMDYRSHSQDFFLPEIKDLHLLLREISAKMLRITPRPDAKTREGVEALLLMSRG